MNKLFHLHIKRDFNVRTTGRLLCVCLSLLLSFSLLTGCGAVKSGGEADGDTPVQPVTVRLSEVTHSVFYAPQYVAISQGFFAQEGLEIELSNGGGADKVMTAVVSGGADIGLAGPESCIYVHGQGKDDLPVIFAQLTKRDGSFLVGRTDAAFDWNDLRGKTIIGGRKGGVPEMTLEYVLKQHGIVPQEDAVVDTSVQFNMMAGAFTGGQGDYVPTAPAGYAPAGDLTGREEGIRVVRWTSRWGDLLFESVPLTGGTRISVELRDGATGGLHNTATGLRPMGEEGAPEGYTRTEVTVHGVAAQLYRFAAGTDGNCRPYGLWFYRGDEMEHFHYVEVPAGAAALVWVDEHANRLFLLTGGLTEKEFLSVAESVYGNERSGTV